MVCGVSNSPTLVTFLRLSNNLAGQYKRSIGMGLHIGIGNFGGAIASNIYRPQDSPRFVLGRTSFHSRSIVDISHVDLRYS